MHDPVRRGLTNQLVRVVAQFLCDKTMLLFKTPIVILGVKGRPEKFRPMYRDWFIRTESMMNKEKGND